MLYEYSCEKCLRVFEESHKIDDRDAPTKVPCTECGGVIVKNFCPCNIGDPMRLGLRKKPEWFKDRLKNIKKTHPGSKFNI